MAIKLGGSGGGARLPIGRRLQLLIGALVVLLAAMAAAVVIDTRQGTFGTIYIASTGKMQTLSQRLAKAAQQASQGNPDAFKQLRGSRDEFSALIRLLAFGGESGGAELPPTPASVQPLLNALDREWGKTEANAALVIGEEKNLIALGRAVRFINANNPALQELTDEVAALSVQTRGSARQNAISAQLMMLSQRIAKNANTMLAENEVDPEVAFLLGKDTNTFRDTLQGLLQGSDVLRIERVADAEMRGKLGELQKAFEDYRRAVGDILGGQAQLVDAKRAAFDIFKDSEALLQAAEGLGRGYEQLLGERAVNYLALAVLAALALAVLLLIGKTYIDDSRRRAEESERQNRANQQAILRLLDEIGNLADGDLTARAQVTEEITGAIADSINYTIDELRRLVEGITSVAQQVTAATTEARSTSTQLLQAAQKQAEEIQDTGQSVTRMAQSMTGVSRSATDSAKVAQASLSVAEKGAQAVQNAIRGMNDIRDQIQETSKRIKRLGESSQEIGEIVQLISDITEQTNVLALNAAIQAASAGEAGRGFTVVAEEVQRLAERSAEATKHIGAIVKSIQRDTQDAVEAMERSTRGVVEGTRTADEADRALREIEQVSNQLAALIGSISSATQEQAASAGRVAAAMNEILAITRMTTDGTQRTAASAERLTALADGLKSSVAGFKLA
ncbi:MAG: methyl-accepting chemotaxis protein [Betaproteobacteria bacterium]|nr:methyl-accepting chemotaxis protein [Betaproteobacteria bacterium]MDH5221515.1 methyl-accepting chemotaxis protein [Betaproteobacteria bacterium]MDH5351918.1 methyl-accepting chemotaxis protein [Betaproteobacteria bacterium]